MAESLRNPSRVYRLKIAQRNGLERPPGVEEEPGEFRQGSEARRQS